MLIRFFSVFAVLLLLTMLCLSCGSDEREARNMLMQSQELLREGKWVEMKEHLDKIIAEYPDTKAAETAKAMLAKMVEGSNRMAENALKSAFAISVGYRASYPDKEITMERLKEFGYNEIKDVTVEIVEDESGDTLISSRHAVGDKIYYVDRDGRIEYEEYEEEI